MKKGNPAAGLAILASIFGAAGVICLLPDSRSAELVQAHVLPSRPSHAITGIAPAVVARPAIVERLDLPAPVAPPAAVARITTPEAIVADAVVVGLQFSSDAGTPPALAATPLSLVSAAAAPIAAEAAMIEDRRMGPVPAAFDRTGSVLAVAFKKTGAGVKTAFAVLTP